MPEFSRAGKIKQNNVYNTSSIYMFHLCISWKIFQPFLSLSSRLAYFNTENFSSLPRILRALFSTVEMKNIKKNVAFRTEKFRTFPKANLKYVHPLVVFELSLSFPQILGKSTKFSCYLDFLYKKFSFFRLLY